VSRLPMLEAQLVAAAAGQRPRARARARGPRRIAIGLVAVAAAAAALLLFVPRREQAPATPPVEGVPAATLVLSHALTTAPKPPRAPHGRVRHEALPAVAAGIEARTPYPPGMRDHFDWAATPADPSAMSSINFRADVQALVEYRAYCLWLKYWLSGADMAGAASVIADIPSWPTRRQTDAYELRVQGAIQTAVRTGDAAPVRREVELNCRGV
jgi:hypothetical protein